MCNYVDVTADFRSKETMLQHGNFSKESILAVLSSNLFIDVRIQGGPATACRRPRINRPKVR